MGGVGGQAALTIRIDRAARHDNLLKLSKQRFWRRLRLHQPSMIEPELHLRKLQRLAHRLREAGEGGQRIRVEAQDVA